MCSSWRYLLACSSSSRLSLTMAALSGLLLYSPVCPSHPLLLSSLLNASLVFSSGITSLYIALYISLFFLSSPSLSSSSPSPLTLTLPHPLSFLLPLSVSPSLQFPFTLSLSFSFSLSHPFSPLLSLPFLSSLNASCLEGPRPFREMFYILQTACGRNCSTEGISV